MSDINRFNGSPNWNVLDILEKQHRELLAIHGTTGGLIEAMKLQQQQVNQVKLELDDLRRQNGQVNNHYTIMAWVDWHGHRMSEDAAKEEGLRLRLICKDRGIAVPAQKVCNGGRYAVRQWPMEAIRIWWPDCCRRWGWKLNWMRT